MPRVTGLRSPHAKVGRIVVFGRMLDKIRLHARGALPPEYQPNLGEARPMLLDARCCRFLGAVSYTHLDVYKRQAHDHGLLHPGTAGAAKEGLLVFMDGLSLIHILASPGGKPS